MIKPDMAFMLLYAGFNRMACMLNVTLSTLAVDDIND
jgi:hypothetical protein